MSHVVSVPASAGIKFLDRNPPAHSIDAVRDVARRCYGIEGEYRTLPSERDQSFRIDTSDGARYILKIANRSESDDVIDFQLGALRHIAAVDASLPVPRVIETLDKQLLAHADFGNGDDNKHFVYLLGYLHGIPLSATDDATGAATRRRLGALMARVDIALQGYFHPAAQQQHPWNIETCTRLQPLTRYIANNADRLLIDKVFERMAEVVLPRLQTLRHQVIHQDAHTDNVLVDAQDATQITGLIDFGDLLHGTLAAELAVACDSVAFATDDIVTAVCEIVASFDAVLPLHEDELEVIHDLLCARAALTATIVEARAALTHEQPAHIASARPSIERLRQLQEVGRDEMRHRLRNACRFPRFCPTSPDESFTAAEEEKLVAARRALLGRNTSHFYKRPMHFERGAGPWLFATDGHRYLDFYNNVPQVGHCHPHVVRAIARQAGALNTNSRYLYGGVLEYAERLTSKLAPHLTGCIFVNSGSEANDVAWQMAKLVTGNSGALIMEDAYHGVTDVIRQFSPGRPGRSLPDFLQGLIVPDPYRGPYREPDADLVDNYAADADRAIAELSASGYGIAAFMIDSAMCSSGVPATPKGYLRAVEARVRNAGGLMICDEVQSGFGRMGQWWGHELHGMHADIVTLGKPVGNGFPLGVVVTTDDILNQFMDQTRLFSTFGGNAVACAAGNAVLDVIETENLISQGREVGDYLRACVDALANKHALIGDVRGIGMVSGIEFVSDRQQRVPATTETGRLLELMRQHRVLVGSEGRDANILKLRPSLVCRKSHVDRFVTALDHSLDAL
jgi:4-aminobutyrate aminotransferase-like enzyme/Ser/Thr protein kinase RdoA (MazF antagonist)